MFRTRAGFVVALALSTLGAGRASPTLAAPAAPREFLLVDPEVSDLPAAERALEDFVRLLEERVGWRPGALRARVLTDFPAAERALRSGRVALAFLSEYPFARLATTGLVQLLGHSVDIDGSVASRWLIAKRETRIDQNINFYPGMRLAVRPDADPQWLRVLCDGLVDPLTHFRWVPAATTQEALVLVTTGQADVTFVNDDEKQALQRRLREDGDLKVVYTAPDMPRGALVTVALRPAGASKRPARTTLDARERKQLVEALPAVCTRGGLATCARVGFHSLRAGEHPLHEHLAYKYKHYK